jgi:phage replication O-like protein O
MPFLGFDRPRYTQIPDQLFDELLADLSGAELKCLLYIMRHTFGWGKDSDRISISQLSRGIVTKQGRVLDRGTGLHRSTVITAVASLEAKGIIRSEHNQARDGGEDTKTYSVVIRTPVGYSDGESQKSAPPPEDPATPRLEKRLPPPDRPAVPAGGSGPQETSLQETTRQETDLSIDRGAPAGVSEVDRGTILSYVDDFARELGDRARLRDSVQRACRIYARSGRALEEFLESMYAARNATKERRRGIRGSPMAYFFTVLERNIAPG